MPKRRAWLRNLRGVLIMALACAAGDQAIEAWKAETRVETAQALGRDAAEAFAQTDLAYRQALATPGPSRTLLRQADATRIEAAAQVRQVQALERAAHESALHWAGYCVLMLLAAAWNAWLLFREVRLSAPPVPVGGPPSE